VFSLSVLTFRAFELLSNSIANSIIETAEIDTLKILECLLTRERLGSTSIGHGIAIPHCRIEALKRPMGALAVLKQGINYDSIDNIPVSIIFALVIPEKATNEHLQLLAHLAELFSHRQLRDKMLQTTEAQTLLNLVSTYDD